MKSKHATDCVTCYRTIPRGSEVQYSKARHGSRHPVCPPITTEELTAGRARYEARMQADSMAEEAARYARFDAANPLWQPTPTAAPAGAAGPLAV